eukprot:gene5987-7075_t
MVTWQLRQACPKACNLCTDLDWCMSKCEDTPQCNVVTIHNQCRLYDGCNGYSEATTSDAEAWVVEQVSTPLGVNSLFNSFPVTRVLLQAMCATGEEGHDYFLAPCPSPPSFADCEARCAADAVCTAFQLHAGGPYGAEYCITWDNA